MSTCAASKHPTPLERSPLQASRRARGRKVCDVRFWERFGRSREHVPVPETPRFVARVARYKRGAFCCCCCCCCCCGGVPPRKIRTPPFPSCPAARLRRRPARPSPTWGAWQMSRRAVVWRRRNVATEETSRCIGEGAGATTAGSVSTLSAASTASAATDSPRVVVPIRGQND